MKKLITLTLITLSLLSCTSQDRAKHFGGKISRDLPPGQKLTNVTWKEGDIWYLTRPMTKSDSAETYQFQEESNWGLLEGIVIIKETKN